MRGYDTHKIVILHIGPLQGDGSKTVQAQCTLPTEAEPCEVTVRFPNVRIQELDSYAEGDTVAVTGILEVKKKHIYVARRFRTRLVNSAQGNSGGAASGGEQHVAP